MLVINQFNGYLLAWTLYLVGGVLFLAASWRFLSVLRKFGLGLVLLMGLAAAVLLPWPVDDAASGMLAPAWIVAGLDRFTNVPDGALRAGIPLLMAIIFSMGISLLLVAIKAAFFPAPKPRIYEQPQRQPKPGHVSGKRPNATSPTSRQPVQRESLAASPRPKSAAVPPKPKSAGRIEPRITDAGMDTLTPAPKQRK